MNKIGNKIAWFLFAFLAIGVSLYPILYGYLAYIDVEEALRSRKTAELLADVFWNTGFYTHISFGGLALLVGWVQFSKRFRNANLKRHRLIGKIYMIAVGISGLAGLYIAFYATGGVIAKLGFGSLAVIWLYTTFKGYQTIRNGDIQKHEIYMIYSYAACFAAVTLRIWLPMLSTAFGGFIPAYRIVAWLCWVPNMIFAYFWVRRKSLATV
ncbi:DUF2306 domain-containing protein [Maribacter algarum]|uniref:DUF2306 domain-containing protein n=1 Tax=Maribacter algarum (ex Zhang et al. 2020) TaxID=2578118 RepID=A0A5S3QNS5_9FLAO|nr:DUF2306 domain-containing protein [Maribacter algarum]TMM59544.1 DUF2306 domain-containing protein [Maribacter algarum]